MQGVEIIFSYFPSLNQKQKEQFAQLESLYKEWNKKINVVSRKDIEQLYLHHVLHSLGIAKIISFVDATQVLDVGTGGGFPGIPLAILFPKAHFHLVDSIGKKITVVKEVVAALKLKNVTAQQIRAEELSNTYDFIVSRAVCDLTPFVAWVKNLFAAKSFNMLANGILYLKGGELDKELKPFGNKVTVYDLATYFKEDYFETKKVVYLPAKKIR
ncbi:MAG: 16S rRNA (guanine(527)-N(7))-methyltransferase RsmG [Bacteroidia bacterium]